jgi:hypothetical protein
MRGTRAWFATTLSLASVALLVLTAVVPNWIEVLFGVSPDSGSGSLELLVTLGLAGLAVSSAAAAVLEWRRLRATADPR